MGIVWEQTMRHCFNSFNANFLVPRPPNLHKNINKQQEITFYTGAKRSFIVVLYRSKKCLVKIVQVQAAVFQEKIK